MIVLALALLQPVAFERLHSSEAEASSYLKSNWNKYEENYHPNYVLDDNPKTAWVEGVDGAGKGEWLTLPVSTISKARAVRVVIANGYQKSKNLLTANAAPKTLTVSVLGPDGQETGRATWQLERQMGTQSIDVPVKGGVAAVKLTVDDVIAGKTYQDLCISDVQIFVDSDVPYNKKAEAAKRQTALAWIKSRVDTAKYFAKLPKAYSWAGTRYESEDKVITTAPLWKTPPNEDTGAPGVVLPVFTKGVAGLVADNHPIVKALGTADRAAVDEVIAETRKPTGKTVRLERASKAETPLPDGVWFEDVLSRMLTLDELVVADAVAGGKTPVRTKSADGWEYLRETTTDARATRRADGSVERLAFTLKTIRTERVTSTTTAQWVLHFDAAGHLETATSVAVSTSDMEMETPVEGFSVYRFTHDAAGKITTVSQVRGDATWTNYQLATSTWTAQPAS